ncbi:MAG: hypothetical protein ACE5HW_03930 [Candidatus Methanofastidiosia archaeon]
MKSKMKKGLLIFLIIFNSAYFGAFYLGLFSSFEDSEDEFSKILSIEVIFTKESYGPPQFPKYYKITNIGGYYYSMSGERIDSELINSFAVSFTDLYESERYEWSYDYVYEVKDYDPHFKVLVRFADGRHLLLKSDSDYHCFIPWNIEYGESPMFSTTEEFYLPF